MELLEIKSDALGVVDRIMSINSGYRIFYNLRSKKYSLYLIENDLKPKRYCLTFPFDSIDERFIEHTLKSEVQNHKALIEEIEKSNDLLLRREQKKIMEKMEYEYASKRNS